MYLSATDSIQLTGNTIEGNVAAGSGAGAFISNDDGSIELIDNIIQSNDATGSGGGAFIRTYYQGSIVLTNNTITGNSAIAISSGGGFFLYANGAITVIGNTIQNNDAIQGNGGGLCVNDGSPTSICLQDNDFLGNSASLGGGCYIYVSSGSMRIEGNTVLSNVAGDSGGGMYFNDYSDELPADSFEGNTFIGNYAIGKLLSTGGAVFFGGSGAGSTVSECFFTGNTTREAGGAIYSATPCTILSCTFNGNGTAVLSKGGAVGLSNASLIRNCLFIHNVAESGGGVHLMHLPENADIVNCTFVDNTAVSGIDDHGGGAIMCHDYGPSCPTAYIRNCIFRQNSAPPGRGASIAAIAIDWPRYETKASLSYSCLPGVGADELVQLGEGVIIQGSGIIQEDPLFAHGVDYQHPELEDFHLKCRFGRWADTESGGEWVYTDTQISPCIDAGDPADGRSSEPYWNGNRVNMGGYGNTGQASPSGWQIPGDADLNCHVNILDLIFIRNHMGKVHGGEDYIVFADVNSDNTINILDLIFVRNKLNTECD